MAAEHEAPDSYIQEGIIPVDFGLKRAGRIRVQQLMEARSGIWVNLLLFNGKGIRPTPDGVADVLWCAGKENRLCNCHTELEWPIFIHP
jgi:hypothetical protein